MPKGTVVRLPHTAGGRKPGPHRAASGTCVLLRLSTLSVFAGHPGTAQLTLHVTQTWVMARVGHMSCCSASFSDTITSPAPFA